MNKKRRIFVEEYLQCWNASEAARRADYAHPGQQGHRLLTFPEVKQFVELRVEQLQVVDPSHVPKRKKRAIANQIYIIQEEHGLVKIGITADFERRLKTLSAMMPYDLCVITVLNTPIASQLEKAMHDHFAAQRIKGEWFRLSRDELKQAISCIYRLSEELL